MFGLPQSTEYGKRIPKQKFYDKLNILPALKRVLLQIDRGIPYHILFILSFQGQYQAWNGYKEETSAGGNAFKVSTYYHTEWMTEDKLHLTLEGTSLDAMYENLIRQIAGNCLQGGQAESLKTSVEKDKRRKELEK